MIIDPAEKHDHYFENSSELDSSSRMFYRMVNYLKGKIIFSMGQRSKHGIYF